MTWTDRCKINSCRTIQPNRKDIPHDFVPKELKLKRGDDQKRFDHISLEGQTRSLHVD